MCLEVRASALRLIGHDNQHEWRRAENITRLGLVPVVPALLRDPMSPRNCVEVEAVAEPSTKRERVVKRRKSNHSLARRAGLETASRAKAREPPRPVGWRDAFTDAASRPRPSPSHRSWPTPAVSRLRSVGRRGSRPEGFCFRPLRDQIQAITNGRTSSPETRENSATLFLSTAWPCATAVAAIQRS